MNSFRYKILRCNTEVHTIVIITSFICLNYYHYVYTIIIIIIIIIIMSTLLLFFCLHLSSVSFLFQLFVRFIAIMTTAVVANPYLLIVVFVLMFVFFFLRWYYLQTAREVKRLEAVGNDNYTKRFLVSVVILECFCVIYLLSLQARSPLYSHISMTIHGLPTIRAYCRQGQSIDQFHTYHNKHTQGWDAYLTTSRWLEPIIDYEFHPI